MKSLNKTFFFDRDGIVNVLLDGYVRFYNEFIFTDEFFQIYKKIIDAGFLTIVITNQQGIGKGLMNNEELEIVHQKMNEDIIKNCGKTFDDIFYCGSLHSDNSPRRKPNPGMLFEAIEKHQIDVSKSFMIGDSLRDAQAAKAAGVRSILIGDYNSFDSDYLYPNLKKFLEDISLFI